MTVSASIGSFKIAQHMQARLGNSVQLLAAGMDEDQLRSVWSTCEGCDDFRAWQALVESAFGAPSAVAIAAGDGHSLCAVSLQKQIHSQCVLATIIEGPPALARRLLDAVLESFSLGQEVDTCKAALEESAMQLAQSFEEQNWLRGFARNATSFTNGTSANDMAVGILQPIGYLLRAQDVYLLVAPQETERSGLTSAKYGSSDFAIATIVELLDSMGIHTGSPPVVKNNQAIRTKDGLIRSMIAVAVGGSEAPLGQLVAINRSIDTMADGLPVYDPEFGSGDVGLLEEAAVLLSTQAHNIHLLVQSNQMFLDTLHAMSSAIDARDPYTQGHSVRVARLSFDLACILGLSEEACQEIYLAGILHDIGKIGIPDHVLLKNGPLTDEEFKVIQQHPEIGYRIVERLGHLQFALPGVLHHHERWDGKGYPHGLKGEATPLMARIMAVADAFDAMTSSRPYRHAMPLQKACSIIEGGAAEQWDAEVVECFKSWVAERKIAMPELAPAESIIPQDSPVEFIAHAVMALCH